MLPQANNLKLKVPSLESLAEGYVKKVGVVTIGSLQAYLRCSYVRASKLIDAMEAAGIIEQSYDYQWSLIKDGE